MSGPSRVPALLSPTNVRSFFVQGVTRRTFEKNYRWVFFVFFHLIMNHGEMRMNNSDIYN